jgi:hypothetical protein
MPWPVFHPDLLSSHLTSLLPHLNPPSFPPLLPSPHLPLQMHRRQTQNLTPLLPPQLLAHKTRESTPNRLPALVDQHASVVVEFHHAAVGARVLLSRPHDDCVSDVAAADFVGGADGDAAAGSGFGAEVALFLHDDDDAVAWIEELGEFEYVKGCGGEMGRTNFGGAVHLQDVDAFGDGGARVVDDIEHGLEGVIS